MAYIDPAFRDELKEDSRRRRKAAEKRSDKQRAKNHRLARMPLTSSQYQAWVERVVVERPDLFALPEEKLQGYKIRAAQLRQERPTLYHSSLDTVAHSLYLKDLQRIKRSELQAFVPELLAALKSPKTVGVASLAIALYSAGCIKAGGDDHQDTESQETADLGISHYLPADNQSADEPLKAAETKDVDSEPLQPAQTYVPPVNLAKYLDDVNDSDFDGVADHAKEIAPDNQRDYDAVVEALDAKGILYEANNGKIKIQGEDALGTDAKKKDSDGDGFGDRFEAMKKGEGIYDPTKQNNRYAVLYAPTNQPSSNGNPNEAPKWADVLEHQQGFKHENILTKSSYNATIANFEQDIKEIGKKVKEGDIVLVMIEGHGGPSGPVLNIGEYDPDYDGADYGPELYPYEQYKAIVKQELTSKGAVVEVVHYYSVSGIGVKAFTEGTPSSPPVAGVTSISSTGDRLPGGYGIFGDAYIHLLGGTSFQGKKYAEGFLCSSEADKPTLSDGQELAGNNDGYLSLAELHRAVQLQAGEGPQSAHTPMIGNQELAKKVYLGDKAVSCDRIR